MKLYDVMQDIFNDINLQISNENKDYFYLRCIMMEWDRFIPKEVNLTVAREMAEKETERMLELEDDEKSNRLSEIGVTYQIIVAKSIKSDEKKIEALGKLNDDSNKVQVIETLKDEDRKIEALGNLKEDFYKAGVIKTLQDEDKKIEAIEVLSNDWYKVEVINSLRSDNKKIEALDILKDDLNKVNIIEKFQSDDKKLEVLDKLSDDYKVEVIKTLQDEDKKIECLHKLTDDWYIKEITKTLQSDDKKLEVLNKLIENDWNKTEVIKSFQSDYKKLEALDKIIDDKNKVQVIKTFRDDDKKLEALDMLRYDLNKAQVIETLQSDDKKIEALDNITDDFNKTEVIKTLQSDDKKLEALDKIADNFNKTEVIKTLQSDDKKLESLGNLTDESYRVLVIKTFQSDKKKLESLDKITDGSNKVEVLQSLQDDEKKIGNLDKLTDDINKAQVLSSLKNDNKKIECLNKLTDFLARALVISSLQSDDKKIENLDKLGNKDSKLIVIRAIKDIKRTCEELKNQGFEKELETLERMYEKNNEVIDRIDFRILKDKYVKTLGEDKINLISNYPEIQEEVLNLQDKEYEVFYKCINDYIERNDTDEWTVIADELLQSLCANEYSELISSIEDINNVNLEQLTKVIQNSNDFDIKSIEDVDNFSEIKQRKCDEVINNCVDIEQKKAFVMQKIFGHDMRYASKIIKKYGESISEIKDEGLKDYVEALKVILSTQNEKTLKNIYEKLERVEYFVDKVLFERDLKTQYGKLYNAGLFDPNNSRKATKEELDDITINDKENDKVVNLGDELEGLDVYDAGTKFKMLITSVAPYVDRDKKIDDYKADWNRLALGSQHFCASYVREDMLGCAFIPHLVYGFSSMKDDALMLSGSQDLCSTGEAFVSKSTRRRDVERYYDPAKQINETNYYNEMDFRRIQEGEKKQPDYIVAFKVEDRIKNLDKIKQAYEDWEGKVPIVLVDIDECIQEETDKVHDMIKKYEQIKDINEKTRMGKEIIQKVKNNQVTINSHYELEKEFCENEKDKLNEIENEVEENKHLLSSEDKMEEYEKEIKSKFEEQEKIESEVEIKDLQQNYYSLNSQERYEVLNEIKNIISRTIEEVEKKGEEKYF